MTAGGASVTPKSPPHSIGDVNPQFSRSSRGVQLTGRAANAELPPVPPPVTPVHFARWHRSTCTARSLGAGAGEAFSQGQGALVQCGGRPIVGPALNWGRVG